LKLFKFIADTYDITPRLKRGAVLMNEEGVLPYFQQLADAHNRMTQVQNGKVPSVTAEQMRDRLLNWQQAAGFQKLTKFASDGLLPDTVNNAWEDVIEDLAHQHQANSIRSAAGAAPLPVSLDKSRRIFAYMAWLMKEHGGEAGSGPAA